MRGEHRGREDFDTEYGRSRQQGGDYGDRGRQQDQFSRDYRQQGGYQEDFRQQGGNVGRDEWSAGDEYGYAQRRDRGGYGYGGEPGGYESGYRGRDEWQSRGAFPQSSGYSPGDSGYGYGYGGEDYGSRGRSGRWSRERSYGGGRRGASEGGRDFWDKASDEVSSWFGDHDAERRREMDQYRGRGPKNYARSDERIKEDVNDRLTDAGWLDASDIEVEVSDREVTLSGEVDSRMAKRQAEDIAEAVSGVTNVQNNLRVRGGTGTTASTMDKRSGTF
ncbi:hypothetical protein C7I84_04575 [Mesorhizobium ephedrae]|jgi:osmotically-inducible protein OsmY|uniref:BON domain-containing protein n=2 Tax=Kumtagia ephedrae TaxID=2116701 RepID=A0A2P7SR96_9HYPH|nr:hypothetical protein C7I84_04575 [Mesorhizobium ephedrae]